MLWFPAAEAESRRQQCSRSPESRPGQSMKPQNGQQQKESPGLDRRGSRSLSRSRTNARSMDVAGSQQPHTDKSRCPAPRREPGPCRSDCLGPEAKPSPAAKPLPSAGGLPPRCQEAIAGSQAVTLRQKWQPDPVISAAPSPADKPLPRPRSRSQSRSPCQVDRRQPGRDCCRKPGVAADRSESRCPAASRCQAARPKPVPVARLKSAAGSQSQNEGSQQPVEGSRQPESSRRPMPSPEPCRMPIAQCCVSTGKGSQKPAAKRKGPADARRWPVPMPIGLCDWLLGRGSQLQRTEAGVGSRWQPKTGRGSPMASSDYPMETGVHTWRWTATGQKPAKAAACRRQQP